MGAGEFYEIVGITMYNCAFTGEGMMEVDQKPIGSA